MTEQQIEPGDILVQDATVRPDMGRWYARGAASALFNAPSWQGLAATPAVIAALIVVDTLLVIVLERLYITGPARFYWQAIAHGWFGTVMTAWAAYLLRPQPLSQPAKSEAPSAAHLFCLATAQSQIISLVVGAIYITLVRTNRYTEQTLGAWGVWFIWLLPVLWGIPAQLLLLWRSGTRRPGPMIVAALAICSVAAMSYVVRPVEFWYPIEADNAQTEREQLALTQETMEAQPRLLAQRLHDLKRQRPGVVDVYSITFAPVAEEDVFRRESDMVAQVMEQRFDAAGRSLQLVNNTRTVAQWPWATPLNLRRAIKHVASLMDRNEDVLFIHLTSHGARHGELAANFWPMSVATVKPAELKAWLDEEHIKYRVLSISACFSGSWIAPLADANTLVMTAADAEHTSYGCGRRSELTFFGRAMYDEQLRNSTLSFEQAHAAARKVIKQREEEAGKSDGYSNPQISTGEAIRKQLVRLQQQLASPARR